VVLVVEDDHDLREEITNWLEDEGFAVQAAQDGQEALEMRTIPTLVITAAGNVGRAPISRPLFVKPLKMDALVRAIRTLTSPTNA
jgi:CheY-like chemotaxis protein